MTVGYDWLQRIWYGSSPWILLLLPLSFLYRLVVAVRRQLYRLGLLASASPGIPVIVVGNITAGGTGKTPATAWLARRLSERGFRPGIVSRGYGGRHRGDSLPVTPDSDPAVVGDEPVLLAKRSGCPVAVDRRRSRAARFLAGQAVDVAIADDGLQHYALPRSYEICVVDGARGLGNRRLLPAGPLREPPGRLAQVDKVLVNRTQSREDVALCGPLADALPFRLVATSVQSVDDAQERPLSSFAGGRVHAVAAIGNPSRFFELLRENGIDAIEHPHPDHAVLADADLAYGDGLPLLMTEKDAVKLRGRRCENCWYVPVTVEFDEAAAETWLDHLTVRLRAGAAAP